MSDQDASQAQGEYAGALKNAEEYAAKGDWNGAYHMLRVALHHAPGATAQDGMEDFTDAELHGALVHGFGQTTADAVMPLTPTPTIPAGMVADDALREAMLIHAERCEAEVRLVPPAYTRNQWVSKESARLLRLAAAPKQAEQQGVEIARLFHDTYERLAPSFGYETRADTKAFDPDSPNGKLMTAVCGYVAAALNAPTGAVEKERGA